MKVGTKSVLFGVHCFFLHPLFVARAWWKLYGFPFDPRLWVAFFVHDLGYIGKPNMDGPEGETHPELGARIMRALFDRGGYHWYYFTLYHSRYLARRDGAHYSRLCVADKLSTALTPAWLYLPMARATGEIREYMAQAHHRIIGNEALNDEEKARLTSGREREWFAGVQAYMVRWAEEHRDGRIDRWTAKHGSRATLGDDGVWR